MKSLPVKGLLLVVRYSILLLRCLCNSKWAKNLAITFDYVILRLMNVATDKMCGGLRFYLDTARGLTFPKNNLGDNSKIAVAFSVGENRASVR